MPNHLCSSAEREVLTLHHWVDELLKWSTARMNKPTSRLGIQVYGQKVIHSIFVVLSCWSSSERRWAPLSFNKPTKKT